MGKKKKVNPRSIPLAKSAIDKDAIINEALKCSGDYEKEKYVHDALLDMAGYDTEAAMNQSAFSALVSRTTVCAGYARAFQYLMQKSGIPCYYCMGTADGEAVAATGGTETSHSWNIVRTGHTYCNIDCMWDDSVSNAYGKNQYPFFNLSDKEFMYHVRTGQSLKLPACNDDSKSYSKLFGKTVEVKDLVFKK